MSLPKLAQKFGPSFEFLFVVGLFMWRGAMNFQGSFFSLFQARDLDRTYELLKGNWIFFGPELSGGGHLPGALYYYLLALPVALAGWKGAYYLMVFMGGLAGWVIWLYCRRYLNIFASGFFLIMFLGNGLVHSNLKFFANSSAVLVFASLMLVSYCVLFGDLTKHRSKTVMAIGVCLGLGLQLHLSLLLFVLAGAVLQICAPGLQLRRFSAKEIATAGTVGALFLLPYALWSALSWLGHPLGQPTLAFTEKLSMPVEMLSGSYPSTRDLEDQSFARVLHGAFLFVFTWRDALYFSFFTFLAWRYKPKEGLSAGNLRKQLWIVGTCLLIAFVPGIFLNRIRHMTCGNLALALLIPLAMEQFRLGKTFGRVVIASLAGILIGQVYLVKTPISSHVLTTNDENYGLVRTIRQMTGWSFKEARKHLFLVNSHPSATYRYIYTDLEVENPSVPVPADPPDGFIFAMFKPKEQRRVARKPQEWLAKQVDSGTARALRSGGLQLRKPISISYRTVLWPYDVRDKQNFPAFIQNREVEYYNDTEPQIDELQAAAHADGSKAAVAVFNSCPGQPSFCRVALVARSEDLRDPLKPVNVRILGLPLSFAARRISPDWNESMRRPYIRFVCSDKTETVVLAEQVGLNLKSAYQPMAPYERTVTPGCKGRIQRLILGSTEQSVMDLDSVAPLGSLQQEFALTP